MNYYLIFLTPLFFLGLNRAAPDETPAVKPKILHLTFHKGCANEVDSIAKTFGFEVTTWFISELPSRFFDGTSQGNTLYNIGHDRAERIWNLHQDTFEQFDIVLTSDTGPLSRIFLQNHFTKPLIIWICNRFDYSDRASLDCDFPDQEFYDLFNEAQHKENVVVVAYNLFEHTYAQVKGVNTGNLVITPCATDSELELTKSLIPSSIIKEDSFFLPPYLNETRFINLSAKCNALGIPNYCGRYNGPADLKDFKGIIHLPYAWSNLALFENLSLGIPYFVPSKAFLKKLLQQSNYWHADQDWILHQNRFDLSEWYQPDRDGIISYFDSWEDLQDKIATTDYPVLRQKIKRYAEEYKKSMLDKWSEVFVKIGKL